MRFCIFLMILGASLAGIPNARAEADPAEAPISRLTILATGIQQPDVRRIDTGKKAMTTDKQFNTVYEIAKPKAGYLFLEITVDLLVQPGPMYLETSMIRLDDPNRPSAAPYVPIYWYLSSDPATTRVESMTIVEKEGLDLTFEVPTEKVDGLALWIGGLRVANIPEIRDRVRRLGERK
jgi:hypothetical protein